MNNPKDKKGEIKFTIIVTIHFARSEFNSLRIARSVVPQMALNMNT